MTTDKHITAIDISLSNIGIVDCFIGEGNNIEVLNTSLIASASLNPSDPNELKEPKNTQLVYKIKRIREAFRNVPKFNNIVVELPTGSRSYSAALSYAISCSLIAELHDKHNVIHVSPTPCRKYLRNRTNSPKEVTKEQLKKIGLQYVQDKYSLFTLNKQGRIPLKHEHVADAIIALEYYLTTTT